MTSRAVRVFVAASLCTAAIAAGAGADAASAARTCAGATTFASNVAHVPSDVGSVWALAFAPGGLPPKVGDDVKIVWRVTGTGPVRITVVDPDHELRPLTFGPERHSASTFRRPGAEWGTGFHFDRAGCWRIRVDRGRVHATARVPVGQPV